MSGTTPRFAMSSMPGNFDVCLAHSDGRLGKQLSRPGGNPGDVLSRAPLWRGRQDEPRAPGTPCLQVLYLQSGANLLTSNEREIRYGACLDKNRRPNQQWEDIIIKSSESIRNQGKRAFKDLKLEAIKNKSLNFEQSSLCPFSRDLQNLCIFRLRVIGFFHYFNFKQNLLKVPYQPA